MGLCLYMRSLNKSDTQNPRQSLLDSPFLQNCLTISEWGFSPNKKFSRDCITHMCFVGLPIYVTERSHRWKWDVRLRGGFEIRCYLALSYLWFWRDSQMKVRTGILDVYFQRLLMFYSMKSFDVKYWKFSKSPLYICYKVLRL